MTQVPSDVLKAMALLGRVFPNWKVDDETVEAWNMMLSDVAPQDVLRSAAEYIRSGAVYPPSVGQIRQLAVRPDEETLSPEEAWSEVIGEVRRVGWNGTPKFSTEAVSRAASSIGSWRTICSQTTDELAANRAHFYRSYAAFARRAGRNAEQIAIAPIMKMLTGHDAPITRKPAEIYGCDPATLGDHQEPEAIDGGMEDEVYGD